MLLLPVGAHADPVWEVFEARCLVPYEHLALPDVRGLTLGADGWMAEGAVVMVTTAETCHVPGEVADPGKRLAGRQAYLQIAPGIWQSHLWREPRMEVVADHTGLTARETDLES